MVTEIGFVSGGRRRFRARRSDCLPAFEPLEPRVLLDAGAVPAPGSGDFTEIISVGDKWQYLRGTAAPPADWAETEFDDSLWRSGRTGIGYSTDIEYATELEDMHGQYVTFYARRAFTLDDPENVAAMRLGLHYDDGFIAYVNGTEVARSASMWPGAVPYDTESRDSHDEELPEEFYSIDLSPGLLRTGGNVLAVEVHNVVSVSSDAGLVPRLLVTDNLVPVADVRADCCMTGEAPVTVRLDGSISGDPDGAIVHYAWDFGDGTPGQDGAEATVCHVYAADGVYRATLTVTDNEGASAVARTTVLVGPTADPVDAVGLGDTWRYFKGASQPPADWTGPQFDDTSWTGGLTGIGFGDLPYATVLDDMQSQYLTLYARRVFCLASPDEAVAAMELGIRYDDAFIAYLNGVEVARSASMGSGTVSHDTPAISSHDEELPEEIYPIELTPGLLRAGDNVFCIEVHNNTLIGSDAGLAPRLIALTDLRPVAAVSADYPAGVSAPVTVDFDASQSADGDGTIVGYAWDFGDGSPVEQTSTPAICHTYAADGLYTLALTVTDDEGFTGTTEITLVVGPPHAYYVSDPRGADGVAGTADDVDASDAYPGTLSQPLATLAKAASLAVAGDTVLIRGGTYNQKLQPMRSGTPTHPITYTNYADEVVTITGQSLNPAIDISGRSYLILEGLHVTDVDKWLWALNSHNNIIRGNHFSGALCPTGSSKTGLFFQEATYNRIVGNVIEDSTQDNLSLVMSDRNLVEGNTFRSAAHTLWAIKGGNFNILRNNFFHNEIQKIGEIYDPWWVGFNHQFYGRDCTKYNVVEGNVFAYTPSSGDDSPYAGIQYAAQNGIIRNNVFYDTVGPALDLTLYGGEATVNTDNRVYNNVFSRTSFAGVSISGETGYTLSGNVFKNNILQKSVFVANDTRWSWYTGELDGKPVQLLTGRLDGFAFDHNDFFNQYAGEPYLITYGSRYSSSNPPQHELAWWEANYPSLFAGNVELDPGFVDDANHDFALRPDSPMIDAGTFLTRTVGPGSGTSVVVEDAGYFHDGFGIPGEAGDLVQLEGQAASARIVSIDYDTNMLTLDTPLSWTDGQGVSLRYFGSGPDMGASEDRPDAEIVGRHVFYNASAWDDYDPGANALDDSAIATDKQALLPGGTAAFENYTSYSRGINGVMIDVAHLANADKLEASDFDFRTGNDDAPWAWAAAPAPTSILVREGAGVNSSCRVTLVWPDNAIEKQWLEVTVKATTNTGLEASETFYFGNAIGETGDDPANAVVDASDRLRVRSDPHTFFNPASITDPCDLNRDTLVNAADRLIARSNATDHFTALRLITVPQAAPSPPQSPPAAEQTPSPRPPDCDWAPAGKALAALGTAEVMDALVSFTAPEPSARASYLRPRAPTSTAAEALGQLGDESQVRTLPNDDPALGRPVLDVLDVPRLSVLRSLRPRRAR